MSSISVVVLDSKQFPYADALEKAFKKFDGSVEVERVPHFLVQELNRKKTAGLRTLFNKKKAENKFVIFCAGTAEYFFKEPDLQLAFSAYARWQPGNICVIPHIWTPFEADMSHPNLLWNIKPALNIGFMGTTYEGSKIAALAGKLPSLAQDWIVSGNYLKNIDLLSLLYEIGLPLKYLGAFPRVRTVKILNEKSNKHPHVGLEILDTAGFANTNSEKVRYAEHLMRMSYIVCPRGIENYSIRMFEALKCGRIPVIIDTDIVLPLEINWAELAVLVPYNDVENIYEYILADYKSKTSAEFVARQNSAIELMTDFKSLGWLDELANQTIRNATRHSE